MTKCLIKDSTDVLFPAYWEIYNSSFPLNEKRSLEDQLRIFSHPDYVLETWIEGEILTGFIGWWMCDDLRYVEHYAIHPDFRSHGYGSCFLSEWMNESPLPVLLEIEPVVDDVTRRRQSFYHRLGFQDSLIPHQQPPYHKGTPPVPLRLMTYPRQISEPAYQKFRQKQQTDIISYS
ncbi:hypothetical protein FACS189416_4030 [Bacteroidia bacterium]|nr:hypothetical protein FACS189416_4030 [Bacteroidia bacterium]